MAEVAGLVVGIVGLAGLIGGFKDTIDLFNNFRDSQTFGRDYEILDAKLDIERTILLQWADQVRLLHEDYDVRLNDTDTHKAVSHIICSIRLLLSDGSVLKQTYGLDESSSGHDKAKADPTTTVGTHRMAIFERDFEALTLRINLRRQQPSMPKRIRWAIRDKQKFERLIQELAYFTSKLGQIMPTYSSEGTVRHMNDEDVTAIETLRRLKVILEAASEHRTAFAEATRRQLPHACQQQILKTLWFRTINDRKENITSAHAKTFRWVLDSPMHDVPWNDLSKWLQHDSRIYWISGKAGSGKSTLMKYLYEEPRTSHLISRWANGTAYSLVHHFFWNLGTQDQKSQQGLSRALLFQILQSNSWLIAEALPSMWTQLQHQNIDHVKPPSIAETKYAFRVISSSSTLSKFCFFIDGLDEYDGNYLDGIAFLEELAVHPHIKIIVASRPIPDCVSAFQHLPHLKLHDLTRADITSYVKDKIGGHSYMQSLANRHPQEAKEMLQTVVDKSSGVFLWVTLACRSLTSGFSDFDSMSELKRRIDELPPELGEMFQYMLMKINPRHRKQGARLLQICQAAHQDYGVPALRLALLEEDSISVDSFSDITNEDRRTVLDQLEGRLRSRCGGLLEFSATGGYLNVQFMHRTVSEFLSDPKIWELACLKTPAGFHVSSDLSIIRLYTLFDHGYDYNALFYDGLLWGLEADRHNSDDEKNIFWKLTSCFHIQRGAHKPLSFSYQIIDKVYAIHNHTASTDVPHAALVLAIELGAENFVRKHPGLSQLALHEAFKCGCLPLLYHAVRRPITAIEHLRHERKGISISRTATLSLLFSHGGNPNQRVVLKERGRQLSTTPWLAWLQDVDPILRPEKDLAAIAKMFVAAGADRIDNLPDDIRDTLSVSEQIVLKEKETALLQLASIDESERHGSKKTEPFGNIPQNAHVKGKKRYLSVEAEATSTRKSLRISKKQASDEVSQWTRTHL
jgi:hypothetical protein